MPDPPSSELRRTSRPLTLYELETALRRERLDRALKGFNEGMALKLMENRRATEGTTRRSTTPDAALVAELRR